LIVLGARAEHALSATSFYEGKTIRIIVGTSPGGGYDTYTRLIARHFSKYIPGKPSIIVDNMPGAGGLLSANHLFKVAKPDGLTIGHFVLADNSYNSSSRSLVLNSMRLNLNTSACRRKTILSLAWPRRPV
jgi:tripartite-type tricarboxylate transporter receptor subunit TctC